MAYDGDVTSDLGDHTTHIIVRTGAKVSWLTVLCTVNSISFTLPHDNLQRPPVSETEAVIVKEQWIDDCLAQRNILPTDKYSLI